MNKLKSFQEFRNEISIIELALSVGYKISKKEGIKWPVLKDEISGDKIIIVNPKSSANQGYFNPRDSRDKGTLIHFVKNRIGSIFPYKNNRTEIGNINEVLYNYQNLPIPEKNLFKADVINLAHEYSEKNFHVPEGLTKLKDPAYLHYRHIKPETINSSEFKNKIFNVKFKGYQNIGFPYYNAFGDTIGFELRNKQFKHVIDGSDRSIGIWHSNIPKLLEWIILTESPIDALSYHELKGKKNSLYVSFGGSVSLGQLETVKSIITEAKATSALKIISAVDNDEMGRIYTEKFKEVLSKNIAEDFPRLNDYNEDLKKVRIIRR
jgi:hypothetical protein